MTESLQGLLYSFTRFGTASEVRYAVAVLQLLLIAPFSEELFAGAVLWNSRFGEVRLVAYQYEGKLVVIDLSGFAQLTDPVLEAL